MHLGIYIIMIKINMWDKQAASYSYQQPKIGSESICVLLLLTYVIQSQKDLSNDVAQLMLPRPSTQDMRYSECLKGILSFLKKQRMFSFEAAFFVKIQYPTNERLYEWTRATQKWKIIYVVTDKSLKLIAFLSVGH